MKTDDRTEMFNRLGNHVDTARRLHNEGNVQGMMAELEEAITQAKAILALAKMGS